MTTAAQALEALDKLRIAVTWAPDAGQERYREQLDAIRQHIESTAAELEALRAFAQGVMRSWPHGDVDGGELQELAAQHGLLVPETRTERCGESCNCAEMVSEDEWAVGVECFRRTPLLKGAALTQGGK